VALVDAWAATSPRRPLEQVKIERRNPGPRDIALEILYCGVCHSDLHAGRGEWPALRHPIVPGHEIVGRVAAVGGLVEDLSPGCLAAVGCMVASCRTCPACRAGEEQYCEEGKTLTFGGTEAGTGRPTAGGYSTRIVVDRHFVFPLSDDADLPAIAPLLCPGSVSYSVLRHWNVGVGSRVGVIGLGGVGHVAVKLARAMGACVTVFTTSPGKVPAAAALGADEVVPWGPSSTPPSPARRLDLILDTVPVSHEVGPFLGALGRNGTLVLLGAPAEPNAFPSAARFIDDRRSVAGSSVGGVAETAEMLKFCAREGITADVELIGVGEIDAAWDRLKAGEVEFRFVIDFNAPR
jgi:alcohol dehydrogenase (NADP+)